LLLTAARTEGKVVAIASGDSGAEGEVVIIASSRTTPYGKKAFCFVPPNHILTVVFSPLTYCHISHLATFIR
jgi:hypothetical protein